MAAALLCLAAAAAAAGAELSTASVAATAAAAAAAAADADSPAARCSRPRSRAARDVLRRDLYPLAEEHAVNLSRDCPFHAANDMLLPHERHKRRERKHRWHCGYCGKVFRNEHYLDRHLNAHHNGELAPGASVCLADHCAVLGCDGAAAPCDARTMQTSRYFCQSAMHACFVGDGAAHALHEGFNRHFCDALTCERGVGGGGTAVDHLSHLRAQLPRSGVGRWLRFGALGLLLAALSACAVAACACRQRTLGAHSLLAAPSIIGRRGKAENFTARFYQRRRRTKPE